MPTMRPPKKGVSYSSALAAAYASAPDDEVILDTLEFLHPTFTDDAGNPIGIRVVNDTQDLVATLEADAPLNAGQTVTFTRCAFKFTRPTESEDGGLPEVEVIVSNVSRLLMPYLDQAMTSLVPITMIWRPYLASDLSGPHMTPVLNLTLRGVHCDMTSVQAKAGLADLFNRRFPYIEYSSLVYPGLAQR